MTSVRVLVVEDESIVSMDIQSTLESLGYDVVGAAATGEDAVNFATEKLPDIVLMDIMMPFADGYEAFEQICKKSTDPTVPIIALTAKAMKNDREELLSFGFTDYIPKPIDDEALIKTIEKHLPKQ